MKINKLVGVNHDMLCGVYDAYSLLMLLDRLSNDWL